MESGLMCGIGYDHEDLETQTW